MSIIYVRHIPYLEFRQINVQGTVKAQRGSDGGDALGNQAVQVGVIGAIEVEVAAANVVNGLIVDDKGAFRVLQSGVRIQHGIVRLDDGRGDLRGGVDGKLELALFAIIQRQALQQHRSKTTARA